MGQKVIHSWRIIRENIITSMADSGIPKLGKQGIHSVGYIDTNGALEDMT